MEALRPQITGDEINGVGESAPRRPSVVFWATDPKDIPFGNLQRWFFTNEPPGTELATERARLRMLLEYGR